MEKPFIHTRAALKLGLPFHAACLSPLLLHGKLFSLGAFPLPAASLRLSETDTSPPCCTPACQPHFQPQEALPAGLTAVT